MQQKVTMLLADHAEAVNGKLYINGGAWTWVGPTPQPFAIALVFEVPWDQANEKQHFTLELVDADGAPLMVSGDSGEEPLRLEGEFEVGRPPGTVRGTPLTWPATVNFGP